MEPKIASSRLFLLLSVNDECNKKIILLHYIAHEEVHYVDGPGGYTELCSPAVTQYLCNFETIERAFTKSELSRIAVLPAVTIQHPEPAEVLNYNKWLEITAYSALSSIQKLKKLCFDFVLLHKDIGDLAEVGLNEQMLLKRMIFLLLDNLAEISFKEIILYNDGGKYNLELQMLEKDAIKLFCNSVKRSFIEWLLSQFKQISDNELTSNQLFSQRMILVAVFLDDKKEREFFMQNDRFMHNDIIDEIDPRQKNTYMRARVKLCNILLLSICVDKAQKHLQKEESRLCDFVLETIDPIYLCLESKRNLIEYYMCKERFISMAKSPKKIEGFCSLLMKCSMVSEDYSDWIEKCLGYLEKENHEIVKYFILRTPRLACWTKVLWLQNQRKHELAVNLINEFLLVPKSDDEKKCFQQLGFNDLFATGRSLNAEAKKPRSSKKKPSQKKGVEILSFDDCCFQINSIFDRMHTILSSSEYKSELIKVNKIIKPIVQKIDMLVFGVENTQKLEDILVKRLLYPFRLPCFFMVNTSFLYTMVNMVLKKNTIDVDKMNKIFSCSIIFDEHAVADLLLEKNQRLVNMITKRKIPNEYFGDITLNYTPLMNMIDLLGKETEVSGNLYDHILYLIHKGAVLNDIMDIRQAYSESRPMFYSSMSGSISVLHHLFWGRMISKTIEAMKLLVEYGANPYAVIYQSIGDIKFRFSLIDWIKWYILVDLVDYKLGKEIVDYLSSIGVCSYSRIECQESIEKMSSFTPVLTEKSQKGKEGASLSAIEKYKVCPEKRTPNWHQQVMMKIFKLYGIGDNNTLYSSCMRIINESGFGIDENHPYTLLYLAIKYKWNSLAYILVEKFNVDVNMANLVHKAKDNNYYIPVFNEESKLASVKLCEQVPPSQDRIDEIDPYVKHENGNYLYYEDMLTPLHVAVKLGCVNMVQFLLDNGANFNVNKEKEYGLEGESGNVKFMSPLELAVFYKHYDIVFAMHALTDNNYRKIVGRFQKDFDCGSCEYDRIYNLLLINKEYVMAIKLLRNIEQSEQPKIREYIEFITEIIPELGASTRKTDFSMFAQEDNTSSNKKEDPSIDISYSDDIGGWCVIN